MLGNYLNTGPTPTSCGMMGMGVASPSAKLDIVHSGEYSRAIEVNSGADAMDGIAVIGNGVASSRYAHLVYNDSAARFFATYNGNGYFSADLGIGTEAPAQKLDVYGGDARIFGSSYSGYGEKARLYLGDGHAGIAAEYAAGLRLVVYYPGKTGSLGSDSYDALSILESAGYVGIGTTSPSTKLDVDGPIAMKTYTNGTRPLASSLAAGTMIYNTDDNAPNFSDGTNWRDAMGNLT